MFDFMHFLGFMAFNDAMEDSESEPKSPKAASDDTPFGCILSGTVCIFAVIIGLAYASWGIFLGIAVLGIILGALHYHFIDKK